MAFRYYGSNYKKKRQLGRPKTDNNDEREDSFCRKCSIYCEEEKGYHWYLYLPYVSRDTGNKKVRNDSHRTVNFENNQENQEKKEIKLFIKSRITVYKLLL